MDDRVTLFSYFLEVEKINDFLEDLTSLRDEGVFIKDKIFILDNLRNPEQAIITFNVVGGMDFSKVHLPSGIIPVHRKKETNTLYSINALNEIIKANNNGKIDPTMSIPWEHFSNSFLITRAGHLTVIPTRLNRIVDLEENTDGGED